MVVDPSGAGEPAETFEVFYDYEALGSNQVSLFGQLLHLYARDEAEADRSRSVLEEAGIRVVNERIITPTLEDVFIHQVGEDETVARA